MLRCGDIFCNSLANNSVVMSIAKQTVAEG